MTAKIAENNVRTSQVDQFCSRHPSAETGNVVNCNLTGGGHEIFDLTNFVAHVCWAIDLRSLLYIINLPHSYRGMKLHRNLFSFAVILHSLLTKQQTCLVPSSREVTTDHVSRLSSLGRDDSKLINLGGTRINW